MKALYRRGSWFSLTRFVSGLTTIALTTLVPIVYAEQDSDSNPAGGYNVEVELRHRIVIPGIIYFRVGGSNLVGTPDLVVIDTGSGAGTSIPAVGNNTTAGSLSVPLGNSVPIAATTNGVLTVELRANVGTVNINYSVDSPLGMLGDNGLYLPFDQIETIASAGAPPAPVLTDAGAPVNSPGSQDVNGTLFNGNVINMSGTWTYRYRNSIVPVAGTYDGTVTYSASAP